MLATIRIRIKSFLLDLFDLVSFLVFVTGVVLFIRFFVFNPYTVVGQSMEPLFHQGDFIIVDKITPKMGELERGDVIVFVPKGKSVPYIKRIVGLPNETVKIENGQVVVCNPAKECRDLDESAYLPTGENTSTKTCNVTEFQVDNEGYFVLGDNRAHSTDSRCCFGLACYEGANYLVYEEDMIGKVALKLYPEFETHW